MARLVLVLLLIGESFKPITKCSNRNHIITFKSHLKTALRVKIPESSSVSLSSERKEELAVCAVTWGAEEYCLWRKNCGVNT